MTRPLALALVVSVITGLGASAPGRPVQQQGAAAPQRPGASPQTPAPPDYKFPTGAGMFFFYVKTDKTADFEAVLAKISGVLDKTQDAVRKQQAASWRIYKSAETPKDSAIYVFVMDPAMTNADYDPVKVLSEALPTEVQGLYEHLKDDVNRVERMGLTKIR